MASTKEKKSKFFIYTKNKILFSRSFYVGFLKLRCLFKAFGLKAQSLGYKIHKILAIKSKEF